MKPLLRSSRLLICSVLLASMSLAQEQPHHHQQRTAGSSDAPPPQIGSGTSWQPASAPMEMIHFTSGDWAFMAHGFANIAFQEDSEPRGASEWFSTNMAMFSAAHGVGKGDLRFRFMTSLEPTLGASGYPLLLQTGETADGINPLFDRQHPHDILMEVALRYDRPLGDTDAFYLYFAPVGDPAIGPTAFMHRFSGVDNPVAPLSHHWLDATHISYGVLTAGWTRANKVKLEGSVFNGREPDAERWDVDKIQFNSFSTRISVNPTPNWSVQGSMGWLKEPEILHPGQDLLRMTASVTYNRILGESAQWGNWQMTAAWGRNKWDELPTPTALTGHVHFTAGVQPTRNAALVESGLRFKRMHTIFARWEWAEKDELFISADRRHQLVYDISKFNVGYLIDFLRLSHLRVGAGVYGALHFVPKDLEIVYGDKPTSAGFYLRFKII